jgi:uncharacterized protein (TIGR02246 family)
MLRWLTMVILLSIVPMLPAAAQQTMSEQDARRVAESALDSWNKAFAARDPAGLADQYTEDYVFVGPPPAETMSGRAAMVKNWEKHFPAYVPDPDTLVAVRPISNNAVWVVFTWAGTYNGPKGPEHYKGLTSRVYVKDGDAWKIRMEMWNSASSQ